MFLIVLENHAFNQVIGSPFMPYLNSLANQHSLATNYFANTHPSIGNYFMLTTGNIETNNDAFTGTVSSDSIPRAFAAAGKTWKAYMESLPSVGYTGGDVYPYFKHHNPFAYMTDVLGSSAETANLVPFTQLSSDLGAGTLPNFAFIAPNVEDDAHDCPTGGSVCLDSDKLTAADNWLKAHIDPLIQSPALANSVFIIVFDESLDVDVVNGGGKIAVVMAGSHVKAGFKSTTLYQHQSTLRVDNGPASSCRSSGKFRHGAHDAGVLPIAWPAIHLSRNLTFIRLGGLQMASFPRCGIPATPLLPA